VRSACLTIKILHNDMTVNVPSDNAERVGLRKVTTSRWSQGAEGADGQRHEHAEELEPPLQAQRDKEDRRHLRARGGRGTFPCAITRGSSTGEKQMFVRPKILAAS
jgi:hypothetical protein